MLFNYFKIAIRNFKRQIGFSLINILGLSIGLICSLLIMLWVQDELSFNRFHENEANIYQLKCNIDFGGGDIATWTGVPYPYYDILKNKIPEVANVTMLTSQENLIMPEGLIQGSKEQGIFGDEAFFEIFSFPFLEGDSKTALSDPGGMLISKRLAQKYFGKNLNDAIGKVLKLNNTDEYSIRAVFDNPPQNSSLQFDYVLPFSKLLNDNKDLAGYWGNFNFRTYVQLNQQGVNEAIIDKVLTIAKEKMKGTDYAESAPEGMVLQPLKDTYLYAHFENGKAVGGRIEYVRIFSIAALFILLLACINYMNLATARSSKKAKEVGVRKTIGATRSSLMGQFFVEAFLTIAISVALALAVVNLLLPYFRELTGKQLEMPFAQVNFWFLILGLIAGTTFLSGSYPSLMLSSFGINDVLKGQFSNKLSGKNIRKSLVVFQFLISTLIITAALTVRQQVNYIFNKNIGIDKDKVIYVESGRDLVKKYALAKEQLLKNSAIAEVSGAYNSPLNVGTSTGDPTWDGFTEDQRTVFKILGADYNFCEMMKIPLVDGRFLSKERGLDSLSILLNETALRAMNLKDPLGKQVKFWGESFTIVGIVKDFHISSLHADIAPLIIVPDDGELDYIFVRPAVGKTEEAIAALKATQKQIAPAYPFEYKFLDKTYENMYQKEKLTSKLADWFGLIALLISALGLLGLATFAAEQRTKEIGIRKILGASVGSI
ncbi:MAG TPA: FtsX-like permease family protein, partial [Saprospiraceae bacterium]|nr:FtsX-like permease family protein [Saprospiraceae bacterium]